MAYAIRLGSLVMLLLFLDQAHSAEKLCDNLGTFCVCSEPLNSQQVIPAAGGNANLGVNPTDSTSKECNASFSGKAVYAENGGAAVAAFGFPAGNTLNYVWRIDSGGIASLDGNRMNYSTGTVCTRIYQRFTDNFPDPLNPARGKLMELSFEGSSPANRYMNQMQWDEDKAPSKIRMEIVGSSYGVDQLLIEDDPLKPNVKLPDCKNSWCRMEQCIDRYNDGRIVSRGRVVVVNTGVTLTKVSSAGTMVGPKNLDVVWIGNMFRQSASQGSRYISHGMQAFWPQADGNAWIGKALEIETGTGTSPGTLMKPGPPKIIGR